MVTYIHSRFFTLAPNTISVAPPFNIDVDSFLASSSSSSSSDHHVQEMSNYTRNPRREACLALRDSSIPSVVWFEDALGAYGVPTVVFQLYLLVPDIDIAASVLEKSGFTPVPQQNGKIGPAVLDLAQHPQYRFVLPGVSIPAVYTLTGHKVPTMNSDTLVLLPAAEWHFTFDKRTPSDPFLPSLEALVDGLIESLLDCTDDGALQDHLNLQLCYLYGHVPALKERSFADCLRYEHRQYHFDICSGMSFSTRPFTAHQRQMREALRQKTRELQDCSASRENESLFNEAVQARLLASLPPPRASKSD